MDKKLLDVLVCPQCHGALTQCHRRGMLICESESLGYPIVDGIPHLLAQEALTIPTFDIAAPDPS